MEDLNIDIDFHFLTVKVTPLPLTRKNVVDTPVTPFFYFVLFEEQVWDYRYQLFTYLFGSISLAATHNFGQFTSLF